MRALLFILLAACSTAESEPLAEGTNGACSADADCRTQSDYCKGCDCRALAKNQTLPKCDGPSGVRCLVDPCQGKTAVCKDGKCAVIDGAAR